MLLPQPRLLLHPPCQAPRRHGAWSARLSGFGSASTHTCYTLTPHTPPHTPHPTPHTTRRTGSKDELLAERAWRTSNPYTVYFFCRPRRRRLWRACPWPCLTSHSAPAPLSHASSTVTMGGVRLRPHIYQSQPAAVRMERTGARHLDLLKLAARPPGHCTQRSLSHAAFGRRGCPDGAKSHLCGEDELAAVTSRTQSHVRRGAAERVRLRCCCRRDPRLYRHARPGCACHAIVRCTHAQDIMGVDTARAESMLMLRLDRGQVAGHLRGQAKAGMCTEAQEVGGASPQPRPSCARASAATAQTARGKYQRDSAVFGVLQALPVVLAPAPLLLLPGVFKNKKKNCKRELQEGGWLGAWRGPAQQA